MLSVANDLFSGHPIEWIPADVAMIWRVFLLMAEAWLIGHIIFGFLYKDSFIYKIEPARRLAWIAMGIFVIQRMAIQIPNFDNVATYEGLPITSVAVAFGCYVMRHVRIHG